MFAERGYANVSIRDICKEAEVTPPMIYYYFRSKKGLFQAVTRHKISMKEFIERLKNARKVAEGFDEIMSILEKIIQEGIEKGEFRRTDAKVSADMLLGLLNHVLFQKIHFERTFELEKSVEQVGDFFLRAMKK